jgi:glucan phosphoethanolaminetransferase (alkaline phosphatase superfamily)
MRKAMTGPMTGRLLLFFAWTTPALLTLGNSISFTDAALRLLVVAGMAGALAFLPGTLWKAALVASVALIPYTLWWCGFAAVSGGGPGYESAMATLQTNPAEASGAVGAVLTLPRFFFVALLHLGLIALACRAAIAPRDASFSGADLRATRLALLVSLIPLVVGAANRAAGYSPAAEFTPLFGRATLDSPLGSAEQIVEAHRRLGVLWDRRYRRHAAAPGKRVTTPMLAIFVIGESVRADGYGPDRADRGEASRYLAQRVSSGLGAWLPETCAASNGTHLSVPMLLTASQPEQRDDAPSSPTILGILKAAGFTTAWVSNNGGGLDARERGHDIYAGPFTANPDDRSREGRDPWKLDEEMLPFVRRFASSVNGPKAMILHTMGSHVPYEARYPEDEFPAEPSGLNRERKEDLRYARSLEHGARFFAALAQILDTTASPAFLVYTSDHGENLRSDHNGLLYHLGPRTSSKDGTVPSFVLWNQAMAATGRPARALTKLIAAHRIAHADVAKLYLALSGMTDDAVKPTLLPTIWAKLDIGDEYHVIQCSELRP